MSSSMRSMARQVRREAARSALAHRQVGCPKCGKPLWRKSVIGKKVVCASCGWEGRIR